MFNNIFLKTCYSDLTRFHLYSFSCEVLDNDLYLYFCQWPYFPQTEEENFADPRKMISVRFCFIMDSPKVEL